MKRLSPKAWFVVLVALCVGGCGGWKDDAGYANPVWSSDKVGVAAVFETYESKVNPWSLGSAKYTRKHTTQMVYKQVNHKAPGDLTAAHHFGPELKGRARRVWAVPNYTLVMTEGEHQDAQPTGSSKATQTWTKVTLSGKATQLFSGEQLVMLSCDGGSSSSALPLGGLEVFPSPDGKHLAVLQGQVSCDASKGTLQVLDANGKAVTKSYSFSLKHTSSFLPAPVDVFWGKDSEAVYVSHGLGLSAEQSDAFSYRLTLNGDLYEPFTKIPYDCLWTNSLGSASDSPEHGYLSISSEGSLQAWKDTSGDVKPANCPL